MKNHYCRMCLLVSALCLVSCAVDHETLWRTYGDAGVEAYNKGDYTEAEKQLKASLKEAESLGVDNKYLILSLNRLAFLHQRQGRTVEAEAFFRRALNIRERVFGPRSVAVAISFDYLAALYMDQGKYDDAEHLY